MVWGRSQAARKAPDVDLSEGPIPQSAICSRCETPAILADGKLPKGWLLVEGEPVCSDCAWTKHGAFGVREARRPVQTLAPRTIGSRLRYVEIGPKGVRYTGCRIGAEIIHGMAALELRAGASAPPGRDNRVNFLLDRDALQLLISELCSVREQLLKGAG